MIWLLLFGPLFKRVTEIPGFTGGSYIDFLTPGVVVMTALFSSGWSGMGMINDLNKGITDRFLVTPAQRFALIGGMLTQLTIVLVLQSLIIIGIGLAIGAKFPGGIPGVATLNKLSGWRSTFNQPDGRSGKLNRPVRLQRPVGIMRNLPGMPIWIYKHTRVATPEGLAGRSRNRCPGCSSLI